MRIRETVLGLCSAVLLSMPAAVNAYGQINVDQLSPASVYDAGVIRNGGLDSALWQGVSAVQATSLINNIDTDATGSARKLTRAALLSGGVPPQAADGFERDAYVAARLSAVLALGNFSNFDALVNQSDINRANPVYTKIFVERALLGADTQTACSITDNVIVARKSPYWAKLRAFCHVMRGEIPAAELTADLLARSGHADKTFFALLGKLTGTRPEIKLDSLDTPLQIAMAREILKADDLNLKTMPLTFSATIALDISQDPIDRLAALLVSAHLLDAQQMRSVLIMMAESRPENPDEVYSLDSIRSKKVWSHHLWGGAYYQLRMENGREAAILASGLLLQAEKNNILPDILRLLKSYVEHIPAELKSKYNPEIFARAAVLMGDINTLRGLFQALAVDDPLRGRIALASDVLNNGFVFGELGVDIETRLASNGNKKARAVRDSYIAVAMGAKLSPHAETILSKAKLTGRTLNSGEMLAFQAAARRGSKAEIALRAAHMIDGEPLRADAFAALLTTFVSVGMHEQAGWLAALDILDTE